MCVRKRELKRKHSNKGGGLSRKVIYRNRPGHSNTVDQLHTELQQHADRLFRQKLMINLSHRNIRARVCRHCVFLCCRAGRFIT